MNFSQLLLVSLAASCSVIQDNRGRGMVENAEYGFSVRFPDGLSVCESRSGDHPHGFYAHLGGDCHKTIAKRQRSISIWADYNTAGFDMASLTQGYCPKGSQIAAREVANLSIAGLQANSCLIRKQSDEIIVNIFAQRGSASEQYNDPSAVGGHINYRVSLTTNDQSEATDLDTFRRFVRSINLTAIK